MRLSPFAVLFIALISVPLLEIYLLISLGRVIGAFETILVVIITAIIGAWLLRQQGLSTLARIRTATEAGQLPATELVEGTLLLASGMLLLTPGFFTDAIGFLSLIPSVRRTIAQTLLNKILARSTSTVVRRKTAAGATIEGTFKREDSP